MPVTDDFTTDTDRRMTDRPDDQRMTPQPYPLWCAAVGHNDHELEVGLIVGWLPSRREEDRWTQHPVFATVDGHGRTTAIGGPLDDDELFIGETRQQVEERALRWVNRTRPYRYHVPEAVWQADSQGVLAAARRVVEGRFSGLDGEPEVRSFRQGGEAFVMLVWPEIRPVREVRLDGLGRFADVEVTPRPVLVADSSAYEESWKPGRDRVQEQ